MTKFIDATPSLQLYEVLTRHPFTEAAALAEFIDNSLQSYTEQKTLRGKHKEPLIISVDIYSQDKTIVIKDNAKGINRVQLDAAIKYANKRNLDESSNSLGTYGIGMKTAAIWFSKTWSLETTCRGSNQCFSLNFDVDEIVNNTNGQVEVKSRTIHKDLHFTEITINNTEKNCSEEYFKSNVVPILEQTYFKHKDLELSINHDGTKVESDPDKNFTEPNETLVSPEFDSKKKLKSNSISRSWERKVELTFKDTTVRGFFRVMKPGSTKQPGLRLYRRNRLILGNSIDKNQPGNIYKNNLVKNRLYGELHLDGLAINSQKTGFTEVLEILYKKLEDQEWMSSFIRQAKNYPQSKNELKLTGGNAAQSNKIERSKDIANALKSYDKLKNLYESLCNTSLKKRSALMYAGAWSFFECLSYLDSNRNPNNKNNSNFSSFYKGLLNNKKVELKRSNKKEVISALDEIHMRGNAAKHSLDSYRGDATQLIIDFNVLEDFIITFITVCREKND